MNTTLLLKDVFAATPSMIGKSPFEVGDAVLWKGYPGTVVDLKLTPLGDGKLWWGNSYYVIECENGRHLIDLIDAHLTGGGTLEKVGGAS